MSRYFKTPLSVEQKNEKIIETVIEGNKETYKKLSNPPQSLEQQESDCCGFPIKSYPYGDSKNPVYECTNCGNEIHPQLDNDIPNSISMTERDRTIKQALLQQITERVEREHTHHYAVWKPTREQLGYRKAQVDIMKFLNSLKEEE